MASWLYPISRKADRMFLVGRDKIPVSASSFRALVLDGCINIRTKPWYVNQGFRAAEPDDDLFVYVGRNDGDLGIIGIGKIRAVRWIKDWGKWAFDIVFDLKKSRQLLDHPVPAKIVRKWIPFPRSPVISLSRVERELHTHLPWPLTPDSKRSNVLELKPEKNVTIHIDSRVERRELVHDSILKPILSHLERNGMTAVKVKFGRLVPDLSALTGWGGCVLIEAKKNTKASTRDDVRHTLGQLLEYAWWYRREKPNQPVLLWIALRQKPPHEVVRFLQDQCVIVSLSHKGRLSFMGDSTLRLSRFTRHERDTRSG